MAKLCESHNLALADDGKCVICRRQQPRFVALETPKQTAADGLVTAILGFGGLVAAGLALWALQLRGSGTSEDNAPPIKVMEARAEGATTRSARAPALTTLATGKGLDRGSTRAAPWGANAPNGPSEPPRQVSAPVKDERAQRALRAAQESVEQAKLRIPILMYSTSWCTICESSRYYLLGRELTYSEVDIERDPRAAARLGRINKLRSVPTFVIDGEVLIGFNAWQIEGALEDAARRRLAKRSGPRCRAAEPCQTRQGQRGAAPPRLGAP